MLAEADQRETQRGFTPHQMPPSVFVRNGLEIEDQQSVSSGYVLYQFLISYDPRRQLVLVIQKKSLKSDMQKASIQEKRNVLARQIRKWQEAQLIYMPGAIPPPFQSPDDTADGNDASGPGTPEKTCLVFPSELETARRDVVCLHRVAEYEQQLRLAQLQDSLIELRRIRRIRYTLLLHHQTQVAGQGQRANTRSRALITNIDDRITKFVQRYRAAYNSLTRLDPTGTWQETFLELKDQDNRGPGKEECERGVGDGSYELSWIWLSNPRTHGAGRSEDCGDGASQEEVNDVMRVHWTTSYARTKRWAEEVDLLHEEMRRVVTFLQWKAEDWIAKVDVRSATAPPSIRSGLQAYARKQAAIHHDLAVSFSKLWCPVLISSGLDHSWVTEYLKRHGIPLPHPNIPTSRVQRPSSVRVLDGRPSQFSSGQHVQTQPSSNAVMYKDVMLLEEVIEDDNDGDDSEEDDCSDESDSSHSETCIPYPDTDSDDDSDQEFDFDLY